MTENSIQSHCPHLGLEDDRGMYCLFTTPFHRCYRSDAATSIDTRHQERYCLQPGYPTCPRSGALPSKKRSRPGLRTYLSSAAVMVVLLLSALAILGEGTGNLTSPSEATFSKQATPSATSVMRAGLTTDGAGSSASETATAASEATLLRLATATASITAIASSPSASPTAPFPLTPTSSPEVTEHTPGVSTPIPTPRRIHIVSAGEGLIGIAARYQTSVEAILRANDLVDKNYIWSGQRLVIP